MSRRPDPLDERALNRATLARQLLLEPASIKPASTIERLVGMHAQIPNDPYVGLWTRLRNFRPEELSKLIGHRRAVRASLMRATLHLVTARDLLALRPAIRPVLDRMFLTGSPFGRRLKASGIDLDALVDAGRALLEERPRTSAELRAELSERFPGHDVEALPFAITLQVPVVQIPPRGVWGASGRPTWASAQSWLGHRFGEGAPLDDVMIRYLRAFGPASAMDAQAWCGLTRLGEVFDRLRPRLRTFRDETGRELFDLPRAPRPDRETPAPVRFLPVYDNVLLGHANRSRVLSARAHPALFGPDTNGNFGSILIDGTVQARWTLTRERSTAALLIETPERLSRSDGAAVSEEGSRLLAFLAAEADHRDVRITAVR